jgi:hypothetical protein
MGDNLHDWLDEEFAPAQTVVHAAWYNQAPPPATPEQLDVAFDLAVGDHINICGSFGCYQGECHMIHAKNGDINARVNANKNLVRHHSETTICIVNIGFPQKEVIWDCVGMDVIASRGELKIIKVGVIGESKCAVVRFDDDDVEIEYCDTIDDLSKKIESNRLEMLILRRDMSELKEMMKFIHQSMFYAPDGPGAAEAKADWDRVCHHTYD